MKIRNISWKHQFIEKNLRKHGVSEFEVEEALFGKPRILFIESGDLPGEDLYLALSKTDEGRFLSVYFILKTNRDALVISARDMEVKERKRYAKK